MRTNKREALRQRYDFRCGYCGSPEDEIGAQLTIDHYRPRSQGGGEDDANKVYCCHACNEYKSDYWSEDVDQHLRHPLQDDLAVHLVERTDNVLIGLTERGRLLQRGGLHVGVNAAAPEPGSLALLMLALPLAGTVMRRRGAGG